MHLLNKMSEPAARSGRAQHIHCTSQQHRARYQQASRDRPLQGRRLFDTEQCAISFRVVIQMGIAASDWACAQSGGPWHGRTEEVGPVLRGGA